MGSKLLQTRCTRLVLLHESSSSRTAVRFRPMDDLSFITVRIEDKDGNLIPMADNLVHFSVTGPGEIAAVDNGNAATVEPFHADYRKAFNGLALLIVRSRAGQAGQIQVAAKSDGLSDGATQVTAQAAAPQSASLQK